MDETMLIGRGEQILRVSSGPLHQHLAAASSHSATRLGFMTEAHHSVRNFVVRELPRNGGQPLQHADIAQQLALPLDSVVDLLADLHEPLFFLVLDESGAVSWAFPVTVEQTPHRLRFSSGEEIWAAWAEDAIATPFVQGHLRNEQLSVEIETACAHCDLPLHLTLDSNLNWRLEESSAQPLVFEPDVDWSHFKSANIIADYWRNSLFFWSEEHARAYRLNQQQPPGVYLSLPQIAHVTTIAQAALFGF